MEAERTEKSSAEKPEEVAPDGDVDSPTGTPAVGEGEVKSRAKRNIIGAPELPVEVEIDGVRYRRDAIGRWRQVLG